MKLKILYIYPYETWGTPNILSAFLRISNYLNSRKKELNGFIKERYLDLRHENLPKFTPDNLESYRNNLKKLLKKIYKRFKFKLVAIACYSSYNYTNTIEVANCIKNNINNDCIMVVGGPHATMRPQDFLPQELPKKLINIYPKNTTPFDYIIREEGEIPFFILVRDYLNGTLIKRNNNASPCIVIENKNNSNIFQNLNNLPIINLKLYKRYKKIFNTTKRLYLDFSRGCLYKCNFCTNSANYITCYKKIRVKSIRKCIEELKVIQKTKWLHIEDLYITDMIFLPKKKLREEFFEKLEVMHKKGKIFLFNFVVSERVEFCTNEILENYKKFNIMASVGLESLSKTYLFRVGKCLGKNNQDIEKGIENYLNNFKRIVKAANNLDLNIRFNYLMGAPGSNLETIQEDWDFLFKNDNNELPLAETYKINFQFNKYLHHYGSYFYDYAETEYGTKIHYKKWWKEFSEYQAQKSILVDPFNGFTIEQSLKHTFDLIKKIYSAQNKLRNKYYSLYTLLNINKDRMINYGWYEELFKKTQTII